MEDRISGFGWLGRLIGLAAVLVAVAILVLVLSLVHLIPDLHSPLDETTSVRSNPVVLKSITKLSRYEAASGSFQVVVDLSKKTAALPSFLIGSETLFVGQGSDIAYVDFSGLTGSALRVSPDRTRVTVTLPAPRLEPATLNVKHSYVFAQREGLVNRLDTFFGGNSGSQQSVYVAAQHRIQTAAQHSDLLSDARRNTTAMLTGLLHGLGFHQVTVRFRPPLAAGQR